MEPGVLAEVRRAARASWKHRAAALGHWIVIEDGKIANYQAVVPSTWNAGPRDAGASPVPTRPRSSVIRCTIRSSRIEILRTIHSFDPCLACAVHVLDDER